MVKIFFRSKRSKKSHFLSAPIVVNEVKINLNPPREMKDFIYHSKRRELKKPGRPYFVVYKVKSQFVVNAVKVVANISYVVQNLIRIIKFLLHKVLYGNDHY